jgi:hypothetical protein
MARNQASMRTGCMCGVGSDRAALTALAEYVFARPLRRSVLDSSAMGAHVRGSKLFGAEGYVAQDR